ncbi:unnamed protein product [Phaedon cochleariae]|uniref:Chitin-binding type-2 domain-containing protein n=1 Tax=Phaedon cochleariae TaxID=80249 RepID=A0A9N9SEZ0_PHACE|nr:unnamed protein product [Phaedon cochleariae]
MEEQLLIFQKSIVHEDIYKIEPDRQLFYGVPEKIKQFQGMFGYYTRNFETVFQDRLDMCLIDQKHLTESEIGPGLKQKTKFLGCTFSKKEACLKKGNKKSTEMKIQLVLLVCIVAFVAAQAPGVPDSRCPAVDSAQPTFLPDTKECAVFYECSGGLAFQFKCPPGTNWDNTQTVCDRNVNCGDLTTTTAAPEVPTTKKA